MKDPPYRNARMIVYEMIGPAIRALISLSSSPYREDDWMLKAAISERRALQNAIKRFDQRGVA